MGHPLNRIDLEPAWRDDLARAVELRERGSASARVLPAPELPIPVRLPRGQVTEWSGPRSAGKTAALRRLVRAVRSTGLGAAYVDATGTLAPRPWAPEVGVPPFWVVRPPDARGAVAAAAELLRSGVFGLVIVEGGGWRRTRVVRLQRLARAAAASLIAVVDRPGRVPLAGLRVEFEVAPGGRRRIRVRSHGSSREIDYVQSLPYRLPEDSGLPDRRAPAG